MRTKGDLRMGLPVLITHEAETCLVVAVETLSQERLDAVIACGAGAGLVLTRNRAAALGILDAEALPTDTLVLPVPQGASLSWLLAMADPSRGMLRDAVPLSDEQTDRVAPGTGVHKAGVALAKAAQLLPAVVAVPLAPGAQADALTRTDPNGLSALRAQDILVELSKERMQHPVSSARLPMAVHDTGRVHVFRPDDGGTEHYAIEIGTPDPGAPVLVRLHSACFTGDVLGSLKCDCGPQLHAAAAAMAEAGGGILLYLNQEGRGIGLANKMRAYALQDEGYDTVEANHHLGFHDDERDFRIGAALLSRLGIGRVRLLTNNPAKLSILEKQGISVTERVPLVVGKTAQNAAYLATKAAKSGHLFK
ncbi:MAG: GTP cyclohydrolase II [Rhodobacterales bacterium]|nr:GTP cyclohydrolase II [Rhodobacterales bacterium]MDX5390099.1 GTP cyclohydrolase II [Rhodobacterales bacterium]MDX5489790.1 GTP cyclohydrolase II [Rhodobacterales bacterium]